MSTTKLGVAPISSRSRAKQAEDADLATFRAFVNELINDPPKLRAIAVKAGIVTPVGNLTKAYKD
jgi:hypothetical protein